MLRSAVDLWTELFLPLLQEVHHSRRQIKYSKDKMWYLAKLVSFVFGAFTQIKGFFNEPWRCRLRWWTLWILEEPVRFCLLKQWMCVDIYICTECKNGEENSFCHLSTDQRDEYRRGNRTAGVQRQERGQGHERGLRCIFTCRGWKHLLNIILYYQFLDSHSERKTTTKAKEILDLCEIGNINALRLLRFFWKLKRWPSKITTWSTNPTCM